MYRSTRRLPYPAPRAAPSHAGAPHVAAARAASPPRPRTLASRAAAFVRARLRRLDVLLGDGLTSRVGRTCGSAGSRLAFTVSSLDVALELASLDGTAYRDDGEDVRAALRYDVAAAGAWRRRWRRLGGGTVS